MALEPITRQEQIIAGKDLEPITRMEKFLKEYGGGGVKHWNDIEGKPFGETVEVVELIPEQAFTRQGLNGENYIVMLPDDTPKLEVGAYYTLTINGNKSEPLQAMEMGDTVYIALDPTSTTSNIMIINSESLGNNLAWTTSYGETITLSVSKVTETIQTIDPKYLPSGGGAFVVNFTTENVQTFTADKTLDEVCEAVKNDMVVIGNVFLGFDSEAKWVLPCCGGVVDGELKQLDFGKFQIHGNGKVQFTYLAYHATNGITFRTATCSPS